MKPLLFLALLCTMVVGKAFSQNRILAQETPKYIGRTESIYGTLFYDKIEPDKAGPDSLDVIMYMESQPSNEDAIVIIRMKKGDSISVSDRNVDFKKQAATDNSGAVTVDGSNFKATGEIFLYEGKPAIRIHKDGLIWVDPNLIEVTAGPDRIHTSADKIPEFPGGINAFYDYVKKNIRYPAADKENNITGKVFVQFVIEKNGSLSDIKAVRGPSKTLMNEAERIVGGSPKWEPGIQDGQPIRVAYTVPVDFSAIP